MMWWPYLIGAVVTAVVIAALVQVGRRHSAWQRPLNQFFGGLNIIAAALLGFLTGGMFVVMPLDRFFGYTGEVPLAILAVASGLFVLLLAVVSARWGLVPQTTGHGRAWRLWLGHFLILVGTLAYGSVTFYMPALVWLGLIQHEGMAVLPWLAFFTLPLAMVLWPVGLALLLASAEPRAVEPKVRARSVRRQPKRVAVPREGARG